MNMKIILATLLILSIGAIWIVPKTRFAARLVFTERAYIAIHAIAMITAAAGFVISVLMPEFVLDNNTFVAILFPVFAVFAVYPAIVARVAKTDELLDEKQIFDTMRSAAFSLAATTITMFFVYAWSRDASVVPQQWFPLLLFGVVGWYSGAVLMMHRNG